jgi:hypothetical protein
VRGRRLGGELEGGRLVGDQEAALLQPLEEAARDERVPTIGEAAVDLAKDDPVATVDEAAGVAERGGIALGGGAGRCLRLRVPDQRGRSCEPSVTGASPLERRRTRPTFAIWLRKKNGTARTAATTAWKIRLPDPGSM